MTNEEIIEFKKKFIKVVRENKPFKEEDGKYVINVDDQYGYFETDIKRFLEGQFSRTLTSDIYYLGFHKDKSNEFKEKFGDEFPNLEENAYIETRAAVSRALDNEMVRNKAVKWLFIYEEYLKVDETLKKISSEDKSKIDNKYAGDEDYFDDQYSFEENDNDDEDTDVHRR